VNPQEPLQAPTISLSVEERAAIENALPKILRRTPKPHYNGGGWHRSMMVGYLGEWAAYRWLHGAAASLDEWIAKQTRYGKLRDDGGDLRLSGKRVEVRSRPVHYPPRLTDTFDISHKRIPRTNRDLLLFVCVSDTFDRAWIVGGLTRDEWLDRSSVTMPGTRLANSARVAETMNITIRLDALRAAEELRV
jgi:hypothetical protein